jgi:hypothetical protein
MKELGKLHKYISIDNLLPFWFQGAVTTVERAAYSLQDSLKCTNAHKSFVFSGFLSELFEHNFNYSKTVVLK